MPFANIGGDAEQEHFVDGVTESLTTDLSRIRGAFVIARNTAFTYKGKPVDVKAIGRELNVRYVLEGSVQRGGNRMRVNVQLIDAETGNHLWAERFDKPLADLFDMQDEIVARLAGALNTQLVAAEARRAERAATPNSMDLYFQGMAWFYKGLTPHNMAQARDFFDRALTADPDNVDALIGVAGAEAIEGVNSFVTDPVASFAAAEAKLTKALSSVPDHARWPYVARTCQHIHEARHARASPNANMRWRWIEISPAPRRYRIWQDTYRSRRRNGGSHCRGPASQPARYDGFVWLTHVGLARNHLGSWEQAIAWCRRAIEANRNYPRAYFQLALALAQLGRLDEAHSSVKAGIAINPSFTVSRARVDWTALSDDPTYLAQLEPIFEGLRKAGVPKS